MRAVLHLSDELGASAFAGTTVRAHLESVIRRAGHELVDSADGLALHIDGRFAGVRASTLSRLRLPGDAVGTRDGATVAGLGRDAAVLRGRTSEALSEDEAHDITAPGGLAGAERAARRRHVAHLERAGVHFVDPDRVVVDLGARVAPGATIWPDVVLRGDTVVEDGAEVRPGCWIEASHVGREALIKPHCVLDGAHVGPGSQVGPMAHLRPGAELVGDNKVGNFVEVKKAVLRSGAKASHLTYLGDADIGEDANIGAGTITCNYDGHRKHRTEIGRGAFIGSNSALVAPLRIGDGAIVGAGSILTKDVPDDALAVERGELRMLPGKAKTLNARNARLKAAEKARREGDGG